MPVEAQGMAVDGGHDPLGFRDKKGYEERLAEAQKRTGQEEAVVNVLGRMGGIPVMLCCMDFQFLGGSMGSVVGEKVTLAIERCIGKRLPLVVISASGGARMQEGMLSLMQMAKTCAGIAQLKKKNLPYLSVLTDPTSGGVSASFAMMGDVNIAEPGALIAFAGRRVIEQTIRQKLPDNFQTAEYLKEQGFIDLIVNRKNMKDLIDKILDYNQRK